ncbi:hypothetical protein BH11MYX2_BH11MYX2_16760 [soil metagenome]
MALACGPRTARSSTKATAVSWCNCLWILDGPTDTVSPSMGALPPPLADGNGTLQLTITGSTSECTATWRAANAFVNDVPDLSILRDAVRVSAQHTTAPMTRFTHIESP